MGGLWISEVFHQRLVLARFHHRDCKFTISGSHASRGGGGNEGGNHVGICVPLQNIFFIVFVIVIYLSAVLPFPSFLYYTLFMTSQSRSAANRLGWSPS